MPTGPADDPLRFDEEPTASLLGPTPSTYSYNDALLMGKMTPDELAKVRSELFGEDLDPDARDSTPTVPSSRVPALLSEPPPASVRSAPPPASSRAPASVTSHPPPASSRAPASVTSAPPASSARSPAKSSAPPPGLGGLRSAPPPGLGGLRSAPPPAPAEPRPVPRTMPPSLPAPAEPRPVPRTMPPPLPASAEPRPVPRTMPPPLPAEAKRSAPSPPPLVARGASKPSPPPPAEAKVKAQVKLPAGPVRTVSQQIKAKIAVNDYAGALSLAEREMLTTPESPEIQRYSEACRAMLARAYLAHLGRRADVPRIIMGGAELRAVALDRWAAFVMSRVDGESSIDDIVDISGLMELDTLRILYELVQQGVVGIAPRR